MIKNNLFTLKLIPNKKELCRDDKALFCLIRFRVQIVRLTHAVRFHLIYWLNFE